MCSLVGVNAVRQDKQEFLDTLASLLFLVLAALGMLWVMGSLIAPSKDFYNELWGPAYLLLHGKSPYDTTRLNADLPAGWFPMVIGFFFPLGLLPEKLASQIWLVLNVLALCGMIYLISQAHRSPLTITALFLFCFFFPPVLQHFVLGQVSIVVTLSLLLAAVFIEQNQFWPAALAIALSFSKPHLALLPVIGLAVFTYRRGGMFSVVSLAGKVLAMVVLLCLPLFVAYPNWIPDALASIARLPAWPFPSFFILYKRYFPGWEWIFWGLTLALLFRLAWRMWKNASARSVVYWGMALSPLASPYIGSWDFVVLLPLWLSVFVSADIKTRAFLTFSYLLAWGGMLFIQQQPGMHNHFFWWVPLWFVGTIVWVSKGRISPVKA